ncbi:hypothetical protein BOX15_Mlig005786g1 [Macrostomum lignano]|uniref:Secreted protein n=2 Tax=Macrostomum lignano TaxID=282301 RepID=A0A1I8J4J6_9PLAT|nr:hypothetical protein BOX15_Mlig005786g1 [Macrostomum lignano]
MTPLLLNTQPVLVGNRVVLRTTAMLSAAASTAASSGHAAAPAAYKPSQSPLPAQMPNATQQAAPTTQNLRDQRLDYVNLRPQRSAVPQHHREYANLRDADAEHTLSTSSLCPQPGAELSNPRLNYMELDFSSGRGQSCRLQREQQLIYVELDFRAMAALAATVQAERELPAFAAGAASRRCLDRSSNSNSSPASPAAKASSLSRLRTSFAKSLSRFSLRRRGRHEAPAASQEF